MPSSTSANNLTLVHASSSGMTQMFPDVCKTPTPGGPIPLPYPNIAMSTDTADGTTTVKVDGNPIMMQGSNYKMSSGDEAGSAMGVASSKIKGKAEPVNQSMDVKADGKGVFRLTDPMTHNSGSTPNTGGSPTVQPPNIAIPSTKEACKKTKAKKKTQDQKSTSWGNCGILDAHRGKIQGVVNEQKVIIYFRQTKAQCARWIAAKHMPKPHSVLEGTTIVDPSGAQAWLDSHFDRMSEEELMLHPPVAPPMMTNEFYSRNARDYIGIVGSTSDDTTKGKPLKGFGTGTSGTNYDDKWITGDYDLFQMLLAGEECVEVCQDGDKFGQIQTEINKRLHWDAIQHGPQAQWVPNRSEIKDPLPLFNMKERVRSVLRGDTSAMTVQIAAGRKPMQVIDSAVTVVAASGAMTLDSQQDVVDSLICQECEK